MTRNGSTAAEHEIAIVGWSARFPGAPTIDAFWENLRNGAESITFFEDGELEASGISASTLGDPHYVKAGAVLNDIEWFAASFFGFSPREAERMDPQQRLFLEAGWNALENAGFTPEHFKGSIGVYAGSGLNTYLLNNIQSGRSFLNSMHDLQTLMGSDKDFLTTRLSYQLGLTGPSMAVQTTCSTSLVAVCQACQTLRSHQCDLALAGGVTIRVPQRCGYQYHPEAIFSPDGHCRTFDSDAAGTVFGSGLGIVVLRRLADALAEGDTIHAVIKGWGLNNDGSMKVGYTAPSVEGQASVIAMAQRMAGVHPESIGYVEAHGTATALGDPIEVAALTQAFREKTERTTYCALGSVKSNFGHLDTAAGIAGLIKTALSLEHGMIPPTLHAKRPNPDLQIDTSPFFVNDKLREWARGTTPRRAGVSAFGIGGTNAHVILEEAPPSTDIVNDRPFHLLLLSAKTESALATATQNLVRHLNENPDVNLADAAYTLQIGRRAFDHRRAVIGKDRSDLLSAVESNDTRRVWTGRKSDEDISIAFMFPGQGAQHVDMGRGIYDSEPLFRRCLDECADKLRIVLDLDLREVLFPTKGNRESPPELLDQTRLAQPAIFAVEYALAKLWMSWGILPEALIGHSIGEYVAACLAGVFTLDDALLLVAERGRLMQQQPGGSMLAVSLSAEEVEPWLGDELALAAVNARSLCVVSGPHDAVDRLEQRLSDAKVGIRRLRTSHAFHSNMMDPVLPEFAAQLRKVRFNAPRIPFVSNLTGTWITPQQAMGPDYWVRHLRHTVQFAEGVGVLLDQPSRILLEVGPGNTLGNMAVRCDGSGARRDSSNCVIVSSMRHPQDHQDDVAVLLNALGRLWVAGATPDWAGFQHDRRAHRIPLPTYPFERERYWIDPDNRASEPTIPSELHHKREDITDWFYSVQWKRSHLPTMDPLSAGPETAPDRRDWLVFCDVGGAGERLVSRLRKLDQNVVAVAVGARFSQDSDHEYRLNPANPADYKALVSTLGHANSFPQYIVHLWGADSPDKESTTGENGKKRDSEWTLDAWKATYHRAQLRGFYSIAFLSQALAPQIPEREVKLLVVTTGGQEVTGDEDLLPERATALGACRTVSKELPWIACRNIDLEMPGSRSEPDDIAEKLIAEAMTESDDSVVAYRGDYRWVQTFEPMHLQASTDKAPRLREQGVYLITGGLGGIGMEIANYLAQVVHGRLILIGRRRMPPAAEWDAWLAAHEGNDPISQTIRSIRILEAAGAEVLVLQANVADFEAMQAVCRQIQSRFGTLHGIIHAAGVFGHQTLEETTEEAAEPVFEAKVLGTRVLDLLCSELQLDFWVLCSSVVTVLGAVGQSAYAGANAFLDLFASQRRTGRKAPVVAIGWDVWNEVGMGVAAATSFGQSTLVREILQNGVRPREGIEAFQRILGASEPHVLVSTSDLDGRIWKQRSGRTHVAVGQSTRAASPTSVTARPESKSPPSLRPHQEIEQSVAEVWRQLLGSKQVEVTDNFFDSGGNSLIATQLLNRLRKDFDKAPLSLQALFDKPTVAGLAELIAKAYPPVPPIETPARGAEPCALSLTDPVEQEIVDDWRQLLGIQNLDGNSNFFDVGGNSLIATQLLSRLKQRYPSANLSLRVLFDHPTVSGLAKHIAESTGSEVNVDNQTLANNLSQAPPDARLQLLRRYLRQEIGEVLNLDPTQVPNDNMLENLDQSRITSHLIVALKRDLDLPLYAPEIRGRFSIAELAPFIATEFERLRNVEQYRGAQTTSLAPHSDEGMESKFSAPAPKEKSASMVFILCPPRSGSTLFRIMLSGHSRLFCPPELTLLGHSDMREWSQDRYYALFSDGLVRAFMALNELDWSEASAFVNNLINQNCSIQQVYGLLQAAAHPRLLVDKTPAYALSLRTLWGAEALFHQPKYILLLRHPMAMVDSFVRNRFDRLRGMDGDPYAIAEQHWRKAVGNMVEFSQSIDPWRWCTIRYEELVTDSTSVMQSVCTFLELDFEAGVVQPYERGQMFSGPGDPNLFQRGTIDVSLATVHNRVRIPGGLSPDTQQLAASLGYGVPSD